MVRPRTLRVLVVDDDPVLRNVLSAILRGDGFRVIGAADSVNQALEILERYDVDVTILDLALRQGAGEDLLDKIVEDHPHIRTVVFSSHVEHRERLLAAGATAVYEKPAFEDLEGWLRAESASPAPELKPGVERRRPAQPAPPLPPAGPRGPSGFEPWQSMRGAIDGLWPGDALLVVDLLEIGQIESVGDQAYLLDHRLALARHSAPSLRDLDRLSITPAGMAVIVLVAGHPEAPAAVFSRLEREWTDADMPGTPIGAFTHVRPDEHPSAALTRTLERIADGATTADHPLRLA